MPLLDDAIRDVLRPIIKSTAALPVRYHSGVTGLVYDKTPLGRPLLASRANTSGETELIDGSVLTERLKDFKINVADLPVTPMHLDRLEIPIPGSTGWWQVNSDTQREVEHNDNWGIAWLIHCKMIPAPEVEMIAYGNASGEAYGTFEDIAYGRTED